MEEVNIITIDDAVDPLKVGNLYILSSKMMSDSGKIVFPENYPINSKLLGKVYYFSLALWDEVRSDLHTIRRNTDLSLDEPFTVMNIEGNNIYNIIQTTDCGVKIGHIKLLGENNRKRTSVYIAFLIEGNTNESL